MPKQAVKRKPKNSAGERRRKAMVEAAYALFIEKGYTSVTVDDIIGISGGSKSSLYKFFDTKEGILKAVIESLADQVIENMSMNISAGLKPAEALRRIGAGIANFALSENAIYQYRLAVANAGTHPDLGALWYKCGPQRAFDGFAEYLAKEAAAGRLKIKNPSRAAQFFLGMIVFKDNMTMSIGAAPPSKSQIEEIVAEAVRVFLAAYGK